MRGSVTGFYIEYFFNEKDLFGQFLSLNVIRCSGRSVSKSCENIVLQSIYFQVGKHHCNISLWIFASIESRYDSIALILSMAANFAHMLVTVLLFSMVPDTVEYGKVALKTVGNRMAMSFAGHLLALKFGIALGGA